MFVTITLTRDLIIIWLLNIISYQNWVLQILLEANSPTLMYLKVTNWFEVELFEVGKSMCCCHPLLRNFVH